MKSFLLEIITPQRRAFAQEVDMLSAPTANGRIGVLANHRNLFTELSEGEIKITTGKKEYFLAIGGGFMDIAQNKVSILVSQAVHADELNEQEIQKAQQAAREVLSKAEKGKERASALSLLRRSSLEMKVLQRYRRSGTPTRAS